MKNLEIKENLIRIFGEKYELRKNDCILPTMFASGITSISYEDVQKIANLHWNLIVQAISESEKTVFWIRLAPYILGYLFLSKKILPKDLENAEEINSCYIRFIYEIEDIPYILHIQPCKDNLGHIYLSHVEEFCL